VRVEVPKELYLALSDTTSIPFAHVYELVGTVSSMNDGKLMLRHNGQGAPLTLPFESINRLEISLGGSSRTSSFFKGAGLGLLLGGGVGALIGATAESDSYDPLAGGIILGGVLGMLTGGIIGLVIGGEDWEEIEGPFDGIDVGVSRRRQGELSLSLSRRF